MDLEATLAEHYHHGSLLTAILAALVASGKDIEHLTPADLAPVDEFHVGGRRATVEFAAALAPRAGAKLIDIGCGLGGASRYFAQELGCRVTGVDLTEEYVSVAAALAARLGLSDRVSYQTASALALPFAADEFDAAYMLHVGMNVPDKASLFAEVRRVLKPGGKFGIYDVMRTGDGEAAFPLPWASGPAASFVDEAAHYRAGLEQAGFVVESERNLRDLALDVFARASRSAGSPLGLHLAMGSTAAAKLRNLAAAISGGVLSPVEMIARNV